MIGLMKPPGTRGLAAFLTAAMFALALGAVHVHDMPAGDAIAGHGSERDAMPADCPACMLAHSPSDAAAPSSVPAAPCEAILRPADDGPGSPDRRAIRSCPGRGPPVSV